MDYNGWSTYETWLVKVWYEPETLDDIAQIKDMLEDYIDDMPGIFRDMIDFDAINWEELERSCS